MLSLLPEHVLQPLPDEFHQPGQITGYSFTFEISESQDAFECKDNCRHTLGDGYSFDESVAFLKKEPRQLNCHVQHAVPPKDIPQSFGFHCRGFSHPLHYHKYFLCTDSVETEEAQGAGRTSDESQS